MNMKDFEDQLVKIFNACPLPFEAKRYVVVKFFTDVENTYRQFLEKSLERKEEEEKNV